MPAHPVKIDLNQVQHLASLGLSQQQIADSLGVSRTTIQRRLGNHPGGDKDPAFEAAFNQGKASLCAAAAENVAKSVAAGDLDTSKWVLRNLYQWHERYQSEANSDRQAQDQKPLFIINLSGVNKADERIVLGETIEQ